MFKIANNRFLDAFLKLMLFSAVLHIATLIIVSIKKADAAPLNFFSIVGVDQFIPGIDKGLSSQITSLSLIIILYGMIYLLYTKKD